MSNGALPLKNKFQKKYFPEISSIMLQGASSNLVRGSTNSLSARNNAKNCSENRLASQ